MCGWICCLDNCFSTKVREWFVCNRPRGSVQQRTAGSLLVSRFLCSECTLRAHPWPSMLCWIDLWMNAALFNANYVNSSLGVNTVLHHSMPQAWTAGSMLMVQMFLDHQIV